MSLFSRWYHPDTLKYVYYKKSKNYNISPQVKWYVFCKDSHLYS